MGNETLAARVMITCKRLSLIEANCSWLDGSGVIFVLLHTTSGLDPLCLLDKTLSVAFCHRWRARSMPFYQLFDGTHKAACYA